jgi:ATP-binding protein involved in chromosome partitioning
MPSNEEVLQALSQVAGPNGKPLPESGAMDGLSVQQGKVYVTLSVTPEQVKAGEPMRKAAHDAIMALPGVVAAFVTLTAERAPPPAAEPAPGGGAGLDHVKKIIAVASGKGGVGKSTTSANLAVALAASGLKVGLLDADVFGPSVPLLFGLSGKPSYTGDGKMLAPFEKFGVKLMSIGFLIPDGQAVVWRGALVMTAIKQLLRDVDWGDLDILVVDLPPGTGDVQLTLAQNVALAGAVVVSTPQDLALIDARRAVAMFHQVKTPIFGLFENMSYFLCPHCGGRSDIFSHGGAKDEAEKSGLKFLGAAPLDIKVRESADSGAPIAAASPESPAARPYFELAQAVRDALAQESRKAPSFSVG